jgi:hypothetical protein
MDRFLGTPALGLLLTQALAACTETPREQLLAAIATKVGCTGDFLAQVVAGAGVPLTTAQLDALAGEVALDPVVIRSAAAPDPEHVRSAERERLAAIDAVALPGHRELIARLKASGASAEQAAVQLCHAERARLVQARSDALRDLELDDASIPPIAPAPQGGPGPVADESGLADQMLASFAAATGRKHNVIRR